MNTSLTNFRQNTKHMTHVQMCMQQILKLRLEIQMTDLVLNPYFPHTKMKIRMQNMKQLCISSENFSNIVHLNKPLKSLSKIEFGPNYIFVGIFL